MRISWIELNPVVTYATYIKCRPNFQFGPRVIFEHQFIYIHKGKGIANIQGRNYELKEGDLYYYGPQVAHLFRADGEAPFEMVAMHFEFIGDIRTDALRKPTAKDISSIHAIPKQSNQFAIGPKGLDELVFTDYVSTTGSGFGQIMIQIANQYRLNNTMTAMVNRGLFLYGLKTLHQFKYQVSEHLSPQDHITFVVKSQLVQHAALLYDRNWLEQWSGYNEDYISRKFREKFGVSPHEFHILHKIELAKDYIEHADLSMTEISEKLHFASVHYFSKVFKKSVGQSPMQYKRNFALLNYQ